MTQFDKVIPPGSEGKIRASVDISHSKGPINKSVDFKSNDPISPQQKLNIKAEVKVYVDVQPAEMVRFSMSKGGQVPAQQLTLIPQAGVKVLKVTGAENLVKATLEPSGDQLRLKVTLNDGLAVGNYDSALNVALEGPLKEITIPVAVFVRGPVSVMPPVVSFYINNFPAEVEVAYTTDVKQAPDLSALTTEKAEAGRRFSVISQNDEWYQIIASEKQEQLKDGKTIPSRKIGWVRKAAVKTTRESPLPGPQKVALQNSAGTLKILDYATDMQDIKLKAENQNPNTYQLTVTLVNADRNKKNLRGTIRVKTDNAEQPELKIPVVIRVG